MGLLRDRQNWRRRRGPVRRALRRILLLLVLGALGSAVLTAGATLCLRWIDPPTTAFMALSRLAARSEGRADYRIRHYWVDWRHIAPPVKLAVVAAEDQRFLAHVGFDLESIADAVHERVTTGRKRGASTISQQVAKNLFLWPERNLLRKGLEAYFTAMIELFWSKQRILEVYLNVAQFGDGIFGVEAAGLHYFCRPADELGPREAAILASVLPNPVRYRADRPSAYVRSRSRWIREQMRLLGGSDYLRELPDL
jgi:monofunctional biosynthetic peptidoglycan transglycosylase